MRAVVQRVSQAYVEVEGRRVGEIGAGLLVYVGVQDDDDDAHVAYIVDKLRHLRIFPDDNDKLNRDVQETGAGMLLVSAFTTQGDARKGRRPSFDHAGKGDFAKALFDGTCDALHTAGVPVARGVFGAMMNVHSINAGPVCILLDSNKTF